MVAIFIGASSLNVDGLAASRSRLSCAATARLAAACAAGGCLLN